MEETRIVAQSEKRERGLRKRATVGRDGYHTPPDDGRNAKRITPEVAGKTKEKEREKERELHLDLGEYGAKGAEGRGIKGSTQARNLVSMGVSLVKDKMAE